MNNIHIGIIGSPEDVVFKDKVIKIDNWVALSANGSISLPKSVIKLNFLAIKPSNTSVKPDIVRSMKAIKYLLHTSETIINGIKTNLDKVYLVYFSS